MSCTQKSKFCNSIIDELQDYMLFKQTIDQAFKHVSAPAPSLVPTRDTNRLEKRRMETRAGTLVLDEATNRDKIIKPCQSDSLFWCLYIFLKGVDAYKTVNNHFVVENEEKIKMVELLRVNKKYIKERKWGYNESELSVTGNQISITTFATICALHKIEVLFIDNTNRTCCRMGSDSESCSGRSHNKNILYKSSTSLRFECELNVPDVKCDGYYQITSIFKPINAISSYTIKELTEMCKSLSLDHVLVKDNLGKPSSKQQLYQALCSKLGVTKEDSKVK